MYGYLAEVRSKLRESVSRLHKDIKGISIGIMGIGDYCDSVSANTVHSCFFPRRP